MSRSFKSSPIALCKNGGYKKYKKLSNKRVRKSSILLPKGNKYKRLLNSWNIIDYSDRMTISEYTRYVDSSMKHNDNCSLNGWIMGTNDYYRCYVRK